MTAERCRSFVNAPLKFRLPASRSDRSESMRAGEQSMADATSQLQCPVSAQSFDFYDDPNGFASGTASFMTHQRFVFLLLSVVLSAPAACLAQLKLVRPVASTPPPATALDSSAPLGSRANPVRSAGPIGERDYLLRLRCPEGDAPTFERRGSIGPGPYGNTLDEYTVSCASGRRTSVILDMYHRHRELGAAPGFTVLPEHPARLAKGCPPEVPGVAPGQYVFNTLEVERSARAISLSTNLNGISVRDSALTRFVVGTDGQIDPGTIQFPYPPVAPLLDAAIREQLAGARFEPAVHAGDCAVPQSVELRFTSTASK